MERYTKRLQNGVASWAYPNDCYGDDEVRNKVFKSVHRQNACEKLAAIEDILGDEYDMDRLRELVENDKSCYTCKNYKGEMVCGFKGLDMEINPQEGCVVREAALRREQDV